VVNVEQTSYNKWQDRMWFHYRKMTPWWSSQLGHTHVTINTSASITCNQHASMPKTYWCLIVWHNHIYIEVKHGTLCTKAQRDYYSIIRPKFCQCGIIVIHHHGWITLYNCKVSYPNLRAIQYLHVWKVNQYMKVSSGYYAYLTI